jgi:hypothetical protein
MILIRLFLLFRDPRLDQIFPKRMRAMPISRACILFAGALLDPLGDLKAEKLWAKYWALEAGACTSGFPHTL